MADSDGLVTGEDGLRRCAWHGNLLDYRRYHDEEWGRPVADDIRLFEKLCLEGFQSGLSWLTILRKRPAFRRAFADFRPDVVAKFVAGDVDRLLADPSIVRNRRKIEAAVGNAQAALEISEGLSALVWSYAPDTHPAPRSMSEVPAWTPESRALARDLKRRGVRFVGPTTAYALMQACGLVNDHLAGCIRR